MNRGKYVLIEGGDGSGKSTQISMLELYLRGKNIPFIRTREPGGTKISDIFRDIVLTKRKEKLTPQAELFSYLAARSQLIFHVVKPNLEKGTWVICDRGYPSTIAYQGFGLGIPLFLIRILNNNITYNGTIIPDLIFVIDVPVEIGLKKATEHSADRQESRGIEFHRRVYQGYKFYLNINKQSVCIPYIENNPEEMHRQIIQKLEERFGI